MIVDVSMILLPVIVMVVIVVCVSVFGMTEGGAQATNKKAQTDHHHDPAGDEAQDRKEAFGNHVLRRKQGHQSKREDAHRVRDRHRQAEKSGVPRRPSRPDEVRADNRLTVTGRKRMQRAERHRDKQSEQRHRRCHFRRCY